MKLVKKVLKTLRNFSKCLENFQILTFVDFLAILDFWWSNWTIWNALMMRNFDFQSWPKKSKFDFVWTVDFLSDDSKLPLSINYSVGDVLSQEIRSRWCIRALEIMPQAIRSCPEQKVNGTLPSVKTLIWSIQSLELDWNEFWGPNVDCWWRLIIWDEWTTKP